MGVSGLVVLIVGFLFYSLNSDTVSLCRSDSSALLLFAHASCARANDLLNLGIALAAIGFIALFCGAVFARAVFTTKSRTQPTDSPGADSNFFDGSPSDP
jgi:hypothetical protein